MIIGAYMEEGKIVVVASELDMMWQEITLLLDRLHYSNYRRSRRSVWSLPLCKKVSEQQFAIKYYVTLILILKMVQSN